MISSKDDRDLIYENNYNCCFVFAIVRLYMGVVSASSLYRCLPSRN